MNSTDTQKASTMDKINITFDLETLGNTYEAPIVQIGAVKFTDDGFIIDSFRRDVKISCLSRYDFHVDYSTLQWWFEQEDEAIKSVMCPKNGIDLRQALRQFVEWVGKPSEYVYWSHATFDPPILKNNFIKVGLEFTLPFRSQRDIRTLTHFSGKVFVKREGIHHNALDDCMYQAAYISKGIKAINKP